MIKYKSEYTIKIKIDAVMPDKHTEEELKSVVKEKARESIVAFLSGYLFDPEGKVISQDVSIIKHEKI